MWWLGNELLWLHPWSAQVRSLGVWWFDILALRHISSSNSPHQPLSRWSLMIITLRHCEPHEAASPAPDMEIQFIPPSVCELSRHILYEAPESALDCWPRADPGNVLIFILAPLSSAPVSARVSLEHDLTQQKIFTTATRKCRKLQWWIRQAGTEWMSVI